MDELYKMILVDDEDEVRGRISSKISEESGFKVVGTAGNGYDALELIEEYSPHVVLTDIKMPYINGIELASLIRRDFPTIRIAFITGFDELDYAKEAIELNVSSYMTKPLTQNDISRFLNKLKLELDEEFREKYNLKLLRKKYEESIPLILDNYFISYLLGARIGNTSDTENLKQYGVSLDDKSYLLGFITLERDEKLRDVIEYEKMKLSVRSVSSNILERYNFVFYSFLFNDGIVFIIKKKGSAFRKTIDPVLYEIVKMNERFLSSHIDLGVSTLHEGFKQLRLAYEEAEKALNNSRFLNKGRIAYIEEIEEKTPTLFSLSDSEVREIEHASRYANDSELRNLIESLKMKSLRDNKSMSNYYPCAINLINILIQFSQSVEADLYVAAGGDVQEMISQFHSLEQVFDWFLALLLKLREKNVTSRVSNSQKLLDNAVKYIEQNYTDPTISMEKACEHLGISISYLSLLFKKEKQTTFIKYLTKTRMERAMELLRLTGDRIVEISGQCGYSDVYYFSHSFKKYKGVSPRKYREEINS